MNQIAGAGYPSNPDIRKSRRGLAAGAWLLAFLAAAIGNSITEWMDARRDGFPVQFWQPLTWQLTSIAASLALLPMLLWACDRWPLHADTWRRRLPGYALGSVVWCLLHVSGMVLLRKLIYAVDGGHYQFGDWPAQWVYEYLKDVRTFALIVTLAHTVSWFGRRLKGEVHLLDAPDEGAPVESLERPMRFLVRKLGREFLVATADIEWAQASGNYVNLRVRGHDYPLRSTLGEFEARLDSSIFARVHRSYIVNLDQVVSIEPLDTGDARLHMKDGRTLPCSRRYRADLRGRVSAGASESGA